MKKFLKAISVFGLVLVMVVVLGTAISAHAQGEEHIADGVYIGTIYVGGMTESEAQEAVDAYIEIVSKAELTLSAGERSIQTTAAQLGLSFASQGVVEEAFEVCKTGSLIQRYKDTKDLENGEKIIELQLSIDRAATAALLEEHLEELDQEVVNNGLVRENGEFVFVEGAQGIAVNISESVAVIEQFLNGDWNGEDAEIELTAEIVEPEGSREDLARIQDVIGTYHTNFGGPTENRRENIRVAAEKIDGTVLYPGEEFSVYQTIGPLDAANGYKLAGSYVNGTVVDDYGGGVCQVSSTLYNAVLAAELEVVERSPHSMIVSYVKPSMDAAIAGDYKDLKFKNNQDIPVYIEASIVGTELYFNIYGEETRPSNRVVTYESEIVSEENPGTQFVATADPVGYVAQVQSAHIGYVARLWKVVTVDGVEESREIWNRSTYRSSPRIVNVGTASADANITAAINAAIATGDEATVYAAIAPYAGEAAAILNSTPAATTDTGTAEQTTPSSTDTTQNNGNTGNSGSTDNNGNTGNGGNADNSGNTGNAGNTGNSGNSGSTGDGGSAGDSGSAGNSGSTGDGSGSADDGSTGGGSTGDGSGSADDGSTGGGSTDGGDAGTATP